MQMTLTIALDDALCQLQKSVSLKWELMEYLTILSMLGSSSLPIENWNFHIAGRDGKTHKLDFCIENFRYQKYKSRTYFKSHLLRCWFICDIYSVDRKIIAYLHKDQYQSIGQLS